MTEQSFIIDKYELILVTGASGFIGTRVVDRLARNGFRNIRCLVRPSSRLDALSKIQDEHKECTIEIIIGNLQSTDDCERISKGAQVVLHLAAGRGEKSFPDAVMNSVVTTRNLLNAMHREKSLKRFVSISSFTVYSPSNIPRGGLLTEECDVVTSPHLTGEAYCYAKVKQEEIVRKYGAECDLPYVIIRPGVVYGPGNKGLTGRVGIGTFGLFLHLGGDNIIPLTYVDNCAEAIILAGLVPDVNGETFNVVDDDLPTSTILLTQYKKSVRSFFSLYLPHWLSYSLCTLWEKYSTYSEGQIPLAFNRKKWTNYWKGQTYSNEKIKRALGWCPRIHTNEGLKIYFQFQREVEAKKC